ncbi:hypothetical protein [Streptomyces phage phiScoe1]|nr:hypothetical protein [Streptomyces phage phiScoe1]
MGCGPPSRGVDQEADRREGSPEGPPACKKVRTTCTPGKIR